MHIRRLAIVSTVLAALLLPGGVLAAAPGHVTGLKAAVENGEIHVQWDALPADQNIAYYRIYYSQQSILGNGGTYDDFEMTTGNVTTFIFPRTPKSDTVWVAVLGVNREGVETPDFTTEVSVDLTTAGTVSSATETPAAPVVATETASSSTTSSTATIESSTPSFPLFRLITVDVPSGTGILLTFSDVVSVDPAGAKEAFRIADGSGHELAIRRLVIAGPLVGVQTEPQQRGTLYRVTVSAAVHSATNPTATLDPATESMIFRGHATGIAAPAQQGIPPLTLDVKAQAESGGRYAIVAHWTGGDEASTIGYRISQSRDGGKTMSQAQQVGGNIHTARFFSVTPGDFGVSVQAVSADGTAGAPVFKTMLLPGDIPVDPTLPPVYPSTNTPPVVAAPRAQKSPGGLTQSGVGALLAFAMTGGVLGWKRSRSKKI